MIDQLVNANSLDHLEGLPDDSVDLVVMDPPYYQTSEHALSRSRKVERTLSDLSVLDGFSRSIFVELARVTKPAGAWYIFCDCNSYSSFYRESRRYSSKVRDLVWAKGNGGLGYTWRHGHELILFVPMPDFENIATGDTDVLRFDVVPIGRRIHVAQKPIELLKKLISKHGKGNLVLDPFGGSGSTTIAARNTGNHYYMIEMEKGYYDEMVERLGHNQIDGFLSDPSPRDPPVGSPAFPCGVV
ncbi:MAG: site-specific DNA-methyltransferase [Pirellulales bacterium]|nr:site-specific DNA-methyltransferase [Pirellulales bacterium]MDA8043029.1 site-specific DNA-methyltransferase [Pirellulales bacterium]